MRKYKITYSYLGVECEKIIEAESAREAIEKFKVIVDQVNIDSGVDIVELKEKYCSVEGGVCPYEVFKEEQNKCRAEFRCENQVEKKK